MDKWIKENKITSAIIIILIITLGFFTFYKQDNSSKQPTNTSEANSIDLQSKCAAQAQKTLATFSNQYKNDGWDSSTGEPASTRANFIQSNHFNQKMNQCFVLIKYDFTYAGTLNEHFITTGDTLFDAFQNDELASCVHSHRLSYNTFPEQYTDTCIIGQGTPITSSGSLNNGLSSLADYNRFINERMELNQ